MEESELKSSHNNQKQHLVSMSDKDESGYGDDISCLSMDDNSPSGKVDSSIDGIESEIQVTPTVHSSLKTSDSSQSDTTTSVGGGLRKDDSGIYSEKSPSLCLTKENSEDDFSESICESLDGTHSNGGTCAGGDVKFDLTIDIDKVNGVKDAHKKGSKVEFSKNEKQELDNGVDLMKDNDIKDTEGDSDDANAEKMDSSENVASSIQSVSGKSENSCNSSHCDIENIDDDKVEDFGNLVRKTVKSRSHVKKLVDYDSDSDNSTSSEKESGVSARGRRRYRKRKPETDSDDDNESDDTDYENKDTEDVSSELNSGSPILLRHSRINENNIHNNVEVSDLSESDTTSDDSHFSTNAKRESSDSEPDDVPPNVSQFGPPKHKWRAVTDLRCREFGFSAKKDSGYFRKRIQGSLQMVQRFQLQYKMKHHEGCVNALHFNRTGTLLASGSDDLNIVIWNWIQNRPALIYDSGHRSNVFQAKFMPFSGDCHVVSCARDGQVRLADLSSTGICKATKKIAQHKGAAHKLALEMDSPHLLLSAGEDAVTFEIDVRQDKANRLVTTKEKDKKVSIYSIHSNPVNSNEFCLGGRDHFIRVYDKRKINEEENDGLLKKYAPHHIVNTDKENIKANVTCACYNYNGTEILGTYNDEDIYLFSNLHSDNADYIHRYRGHRNDQTVKGVNFYGPKSEFIVSGSDCGHIFLWDKPTENIVQFMEGDEGGVINVLEPHPTAPILATSGLDHDVKIWSPTAENPTTLKGLKKLIKRNAREREEERSGDGGMIDGSMLWFIMHHLRRGRRQRAREARAARGEHVPDMDSSDTLSEEDLMTDEDSDNDGAPRDAISCAPS